MKLSWSRAFDFPVAQGILKSKNEDFVVTERLPEEPCGDGEHLWLTLQKNGQNTAWVARQLAKWAGVSPRDVSYAGLKDRHAVTTQTFSIHLPGKQTPSVHLIHIDGVTVIEAQRHNRKLKTGQLIGNSFSIRLRQSSALLSDLETRWQQLAQAGVPNYFGPQRFGHGGKNTVCGMDWLLGKAKAPRQNQSIYLSAVRSYLFNHLLENRVNDGSWNHLINGDFVQFTEGKSGFYCEQPAQHDIERCAQGQLSPCASLPGLARETFEELDQRESHLLEEYIDLLEALASQKVMRQFRKLRIFPEQSGFDVIEDDPVFRFFLPAGSYATTVLGELFHFSTASDDLGLE
ncbi:MAG: tRNA pseudouridine(13) synthase TruD [Reinekea sp.]|jgi:tRNA pseudouridine13 synthase